MVVLSLFAAPLSLLAQSPAPVSLGIDTLGVGSAAGDYVILSGAAITNVPPSVITGNIGAYPIAGSFIGVPCAEVTGNIFERDATYVVGACTNITPGDAAGLLAATLIAGSAGASAYVDAAGRAPTFPLNLYGGDLTGRTLAPGVYNWGSDVSVNPSGLAGPGNALTLVGGPNDVWIFQMSGNLILGAPAGPGVVILSPGVQANNIFWQVGGGAGAKLYPGSVLYGNVLSNTAVVMQAGASLTGRAFGPTGVTLISNTITSPGPLVGGLPVTVAPTVTSTFPTNSAPGVPAVNVPINSALTATFSEAMNGATIAPYAVGTFTLQTTGPPLATVTGTVTYPGGGVTATFTPTSNLLPNTSYTATITTNAQDPAGVALASNYVWTFSTAAAPDLTPPTVSSTVPLPAGVLTLGSALSATFSEPMLASTIVTANFGLKQGATVVPVTVSFDGNETATITPTSGLVGSDPYTLTISHLVSNLAGIQMGAAAGSDYILNFTTGAVPVVTPPTVSSTVPANLAPAAPVGNALSATFSQPMLASTITTANFSLKQGATVIPVTVVFDGNETATMTPASTLSPSTGYTATISHLVQNLAGIQMGATAAADYVWTFTTGLAPPPVPPTVSSTVPLPGGVSALGSALSATFSTQMLAATITTANFSLKQGATVVPVTVVFDGNETAVITPTSSLSAGASYTATISHLVENLAGTPMGATAAADYVWAFTTAAIPPPPSQPSQPPPPTLPTVISTAPLPGSTTLPTSSALAATFSTAMSPTTINTLTFSLTHGVTPVSGTVAYAGVTGTFTPTTRLLPNTLYTATITTGASDLGGYSLGSNYVWSFTTGASASTVPPAVISTVPLNGAVLSVTAANLVANFSEAMNPLTINTGTFILLQGTTPVAGTVSYAGTTATFRPLNDLAPNTLYSAAITTGATDLAGNTLPAIYQWSFTTGAVASPGPGPVCLSNFAILSGSGIVNSGTTVVTGDLGVSPGTTVTGFPPGILHGAVHAGDATAAQGLADFSAAYKDAVGRTVGVVSVAGDIGGQTLTAGLYNSTGSLEILSGDVTLDGKGNVNAVFIFQTALAFATGAGRQVILIGGAQASNVFWQVGTTAILGTDSIFNGSILAGQSIALNPGATVYGRLEALSGTVALNSNIVVSPPPAIAAGGIFNAASYAGTVAAGSIAAIFGSNVGSSTASATAFPLPTTLGETSFLIGTEGAPLYMTSCAQTNLQIPWESAGETQVPVTATVGGLVSIPQSGTIAPFAPGIFALNQAGSGQGAVEIAPTTVLAAPLSTNSRPVNPGEYIAIFCTGLGPVSNQPASGAAALSSPLSMTPTLPTVTIGGVPAQVTFSGLAPGFAGLYQVNAVVPAGAPSGSAVSLAIGIGGIQSNTVTIAVQ